ncbi:TetR/AcrR family transcriptional regulator [Tropicimonas sp. IMCC6043]|uniref:TetR/AcrR family transcriptional regulator n=1 Tax=Tropicimonas sp. IMCC6043 TaxID=2510645 RepID=UPI00101CCA51|nr:TetR/AcrR family transcriptional regulator [Tropicimonas sp. IMCC6043]RYH06439.1 TetR/AcrR family transcriptional regulator [Tropicimonas sp. IMCC6043]
MRERWTAEDRKAQIVSQVLNLAFEIGPDRLSTTDVAREIGISQPAIFRHFPTKGAMWLAVAEEVAARLTAAWDKAEAGAKGPEARLRSLIGTQLSAIEATPALPSILFSRELTVDNPGLREVFAQLLTSFQRRQVKAIAGLQAADALRRNVAAADVAVLLTSLVQGVAIRWTLGNRVFPVVDEGLRLFDVQMDLLRGEEERNHD